MAVKYILCVQYTCISFLYLLGCNIYPIDNGSVFYLVTFSANVIYPHPMYVLLAIFLIIMNWFCIFMDSLQSSAI